MITLKVNIENQSAEKSVKAFLDKLGLKYSINQEDPDYNWWEDEALITELDNRSHALKSGVEPGFSFAEIKQSLKKR